MNQFLTEEDIWDRVEEVAEESTCRKRKVGCVIVDVDTLEELSYGYNYSPVEGGCENEDGETHQYVIHAEIAALMTMQEVGDRNCVAFVNHQPCKVCESELFTRGLKDILVRPTSEKWPKPKASVGFAEPEEEQLTYAEAVDEEWAGPVINQAEDPVNPKHYSDIKEFAFAANNHDSY